MVDVGELKLHFEIFLVFFPLHVYRIAVLLFKSIFDNGGHLGCRDIVVDQRTACQARSEERRVGKECRCRWAAEQSKEKENTSVSYQLSDTRGCCDGVVEY